MTGPQGWARPDDAGAPPAAPPLPPPPAPAGWGSPAPQSGGWQSPPGWSGAPAPTDRGGWAGAPPEQRPGVVPLRPLGLGELLDGAVTLVRRYPRPTLGLSAGIALVTTLLHLPLLLSLSDSALLDPTSLTQGAGSGDLDAELGGLLAGLGVTTLLSFLAGVVLTGIITAVAGKGVLGEPMTLGQAWRSLGPLLPRLLGLAVVVLLAVWGVLLLALLAAVALGSVAGGPGLAVGLLLGLAAAGLAIHLYVRLALAPSALVLERASIRQSLRRSSVLVQGDWWRVFGILLLVLVVTSFISQVLQTPFAFGSLTSGLSGEPASLGVADVVLQSVGSALALTVVAPFGAAVSALLYVDRRMRAEGLDVSLAAATRPA